MPKRLTDNLNSLYIGAANSMRPKKSRHKIVAYVESYDDIAFWRDILGNFEDENHFFEVMLPTNDSLAKGKKKVLENYLGERLGQNMIACVDSDYDYVLQGVTSTSRYINKNNYVFQTYAYAIENYQCYAESLHEVCVEATLNDHQLIDFPAFMRLYSQIVYPLFLWSVWFYRKQKLNAFSLTDFSGLIKLERVSIYHPEKSLEDLSRKVKRKLNSLRQRYEGVEEKLEDLGTELAELGIQPENTYLFIQGHHLKDNVVKKILEPVCIILRKERENEITQLANHNLQYQNELSCYQQRQLNVDLVLKKNKRYKTCPVFKKLEGDLQLFMKRLNEEEQGVKEDSINYL